MKKYVTVGISLCIFTLFVFLLQLIHLSTVMKNSRLELDYEDDDANDIESDTKKEQEMTCRIPPLEPFAPEIMEVLNSYHGFATSDVNSAPPPCRNQSLMKFKTDLDSNLILDKKYEGYLNSTNCCYYVFSRDDDDMKVRYSSTCYPIVKSVTKIPENQDFIRVKCRSLGKKKEKYEDSFGFVHRKTEVEARMKLGHGSENTSSSRLGDQLSVVILGLDSVSHMNFQRYMTRTREFLIRNLSAVEFYGRNKVSESTFENIVPTLTGWLTGELYEKANCWPRHDAYFDDCPFIWKEFARHGYRTLYGEDQIVISTFLDSTLNGFRDPIVDYDFRTLLRGMETSEMALGCFQHQHSINILTHSIVQAATTFRHTPFFQFIWITSEMHYYAQGAKVADEPVHNLLETLSQNELLNNTVLILMSDHGMTFGQYVQLEQGMLESRMPMLNIVFPTWFKTKYALAVKNVKANAHRLSTPFDLHQLLLDLLNTESITDNAIRERQTQHSFLQSRGISLFLKIPQNRTCKMAGIDDHWCICWKKTLIQEPTTNDRVQKAVDFTMDFINKKLQTFKMCAQLILKRIKVAKWLNAESKAFQKKKILKRMEVIFEVVPSDGIFASTVKFKGDVMNLGGPVSRINVYGHTADCIDTASKGTLEIKSMCHCLS